MNLRIVKLVAIAMLMCIGNIQAQESDLARIYKAMEKGRKGEDIKIGVIGGSITQGYAASTTSKQWTNLMADWWKTTFPNSKVELINAGWGGTGSDIGAHRIHDDLLKQNPDFIMIEFAVNDVEGDLALKMMEGLIQQVLTADNNPGLMVLLLKEDNGTTAQNSHKPVAEHYKVPYVSFADLIDAKVVEDGIELSSIFVDGLHPNDVGMAYIAELISESLDTIFTSLPTTEDLPAISVELPTPIVGSVYSNAFQFFPDNIVPESNQGWKATKAGWSSESSDQQIDFQLTGNAVSLIFTQNNGADRGKAEVWVDEGEKTIIDAYMIDDWGTKYAYSLVQENLNDGVHTLHVKTLSGEANSKVHIERLMVAGNTGSAAPIAKSAPHHKGVIDLSIVMDASESFDPDGDDITAYEWTIYQAPEGSTATITDADKVESTITPDKAGEYKISLTVSAEGMKSVPLIKTLNIRETNAKPIAVPGNDTTSALDKYFKFDGSKSYDDDGDNLTYQWTLEAMPDGSTTELKSANKVKSQCKFDIEGEFVAGLVVFDSLEYSEKALVKVEAKDGYTAVKEMQANFDWLKVYPNPAPTFINIEFNLTEPELVNIQLTNLIGKVVYKSIYQPESLGINRVHIDINNSNLKTGIYLLSVSTKLMTKTVRTTIM